MLMMIMIFLAESEEEYIQGEDDEDDGDYQSTPKRKLNFVKDEKNCESKKRKRGPGRPPGAKNKKSRTKKLQPAMVDGQLVDDNENRRHKDNVLTENHENIVNGESGCTSPAKRAKSNKASRKRIRNPQEWVRAKNKRLRNSGQPYQSKDKHGNLQNRLGALPIGPDCTCRDFCSKKIGRVGIQKVYDDFWALADYDLQNSDLIKKIKRKATRNQVDKGQFNPCRVKAVSSYWVSYQEMHYKVCLTAFTSMHGIRKGRVERVNKKRTETDSVVPDQRGRSGHHIAQEY